MREEGFSLAHGFMPSEWRRQGEAAQTTVAGAVGRRAIPVGADLEAESMAQEVGGGS